MACSSPQVPDDVSYFHIIYYAYYTNTTDHYTTDGEGQLSVRIFGNLSYYRA